MNFSLYYVFLQQQKTLKSRRQTRVVLWVELLKIYESKDYFILSTKGGWNFDFRKPANFLSQFVPPLLK